jgi:hypothetical protein
MPCQSFAFGKLILWSVLYGGLCLFFWRKATLKLRRLKDVDQNAQSSAIGILTFFIQTVDLLQIDTGIDLGFGALSLELDNPSPGNDAVEGSCLSTGKFYVDWGIKFVVPLLMAVVAVLLCWASQVERHERWRTLVLIRARPLAEYTGRITGNLYDYKAF